MSLAQPLADQRILLSADMSSGKLFLQTVLPLNIRELSTLKAHHF